MKIIEQGGIGKIYSVVGYGTTALHTSTSHLIDLILYILSSEPLWVVGDVQTDFIRNVHGLPDVGGMGMIKFKSGAIAFIKGVSSSPEKFMFEIDILGENGRIKLYNNGNSYELYQYKTGINSIGTNYQSLERISVKNVEVPNQRMIQAVTEIIESLVNNTQTRSCGRDALLSIQIIEGIKKSSETNQIIFLNSEE